MKAFDFYKFIHENDIEYHWQRNTETNKRDVIFFPSYSQIEDMAKLLKSTGLDDNGIHCQMKFGYFAFWASDILNEYGIELTEIFGIDV